jgi:signal recognition particle subunit SRP54
MCFWHRAEGDYVVFETLTGKLGAIFEKLTRRGGLSEADVDEALRAVRVALLEADVALPVAKDFIAHVRTRAVGRDVLGSITPGQMVVKIVHDELVAMLGSDRADLQLAAPAPVVILLLGLQGSGKTTTAAKIGLWLKGRERKKVLMAALDVARPAAQEQLRVLGLQSGIATLPVAAGEEPLDIAKRAFTEAKLGGYDVVLLDTAGRLHVDEALMAEAAELQEAVKPHETLLIADALTGQDAVNIAKSFHQRAALTGIVLTRLDGDARGGAALSMRAVTGCPIKFAGTGEKLDALEPFDPKRIASRILGMGDVVGLVEKAQATIAKEDAQALAAKFERGRFDLDDMAAQLRQIRKMGGMSGMMGMLPGIHRIKKQLAEARVDEHLLRRQEAIIGSMTGPERRDPRIIGASRKRRIAAGSGTNVPEVNRLLKQYFQIAEMMKRFKKLGAAGRLQAGLASLFGQQRI